MDTWVSTRLLVEYAFWVLIFMFVFILFLGFWKHPRGYCILSHSLETEAWLPWCLLQLGTLPTGVHLLLYCIFLFFIFFYFCCYQNKFSDYFLLLILPPTFSDCVWLDRLWWADEKACEHCGRPTGEEPLALSAPTPQHAVSALSQLPQGHCWAPRKPLPGQGRQNDQSK